MPALRPGPCSGDRLGRPFAGHCLKTAFTISASEHYWVGMVIIASLALAAAAPAVPPERAEPQLVASVRQAQATVTILPAASIRFSELEATEPELFRDSAVRDSDGSQQPARLIEFQ